MENNYPPYIYLCQAADHCPDTLATYLLLWREQDKNSQISFNKKEIREEKSLSWAKFKNDLRKLACEGLLEWKSINAETLTVILATCNFLE